MAKSVHVLVDASGGRCARVRSVHMWHVAVTAGIVSVASVCARQCTVLAGWRGAWGILMGDTDSERGSMSGVWRVQDKMLT